MNILFYMIGKTFCSKNSAWNEYMECAGSFGEEGFTEFANDQRPLITKDIKLTANSNLTSSLSYGGWLLEQVGTESEICNRRPLLKVLENGDWTVNFPFFEWHDLFILFISVAYHQGRARQPGPVSLHPACSVIFATYSTPTTLMIVPAREVVAIVRCWTSLM